MGAEARGLAPWKIASGKISWQHPRERGFHHAEAQSSQFLFGWRFDFSADSREQPRRTASFAAGRRTRAKAVRGAKEGATEAGAAKGREAGGIRHFCGSPSRHRA